jgi:hypothetical protein
MSLCVTSTADEAADRVANLLADLGDTPDGIAFRLAEAQVTGLPGSACSCAIAVYLQRAEPGLTGIEVDRTSIDFLAEDATGTRVTTPAPVAEFIDGFDAGRYGHLIAETEF